MYKKSAKDLAWDRERDKFNHTIHCQRNHISSLKSLVESQSQLIQCLEDKCEEQEKIIQQLKDNLNLSPGDLKTLVESERNRNKAISMLGTLTKYMY